MIRLIALDFDGTLYDDHKQVSEKNRRAIQVLKERGIRIIPCSGRFEESMMNGVNALDMFHEGEFLISSNGAKIVRCGSDEIEKMNTVPKDVITSILEHGSLYSEVANPQIYANNGYYAERYLPATARYAKAAGKEPYMVESLNECLDMPVEKILFTVDEPEKNMPVVQNGMRPFVPDNMQMFRSAVNLLEFVSTEAGKWPAVLYLCKKLGIEPEETLCIGDSENDLVMVSNAGFGAVPANAEDSLRKAAAYVSPKTNNEDAVADILEHFFPEFYR